MSTTGLLELKNNVFSGRIPTEMGNLFALRDQLDLSRNRLEGPIPSELGMLVELRTFDVTLFCRCAALDCFLLSFFLNQLLLFLFVHRRSQTAAQSLDWTASLRNFSVDQGDLGAARGQRLEWDNSNRSVYHLQQHLSFVPDRLRRL